MRHDQGTDAIVQRSHFYHRVRHEAARTSICAKARDCTFENLLEERANRSGCLEDAFHLVATAFAVALQRFAKEGVLVAISIVKALTADP
jgi:hypothetical protein